ncbi:MAG: ATP-grasp domain-containing protein [Candidatus Thorarchaeota archaeon]
MKIALSVNTRRSGTEFEVEYDPPHTIELIKHGIEATGHDYCFIEADINFLNNIIELKPDLVFNRAEGLRGESRESHIPSMLEMLGIPYVGSNVLTTALALNKGWTKKILSYHGINTPGFSICGSVGELSDQNFRYPVILKPNEEGSSMGINEDNIANNISQLKSKLASMLEEYQQNILIEEFVQGREFSVGTLGHPLNELIIFPILEIDFSKLPSEVGGVFGQRAKTMYDSLDHYICPAGVSKEIQEEIERMVLDVCRILEIKDFARIDLRMNHEGEIFFLEVNPLPGMDFDMEENDFSFYPYMAMKAGYSYDQLIRGLLLSACDRYGLKL